ncbi:MAG TPA: chromosome segregation protein SMC [Polyangiaceae bacterium]|jgi:chromosome segregation protein|nr:chromosome segregation protein SMC [Polyangiaceae bacterium]
MHIKKLEITGFKSFVDRTVIHFDHDVVGIVGPNGCGKSNIVDAIRWVLGEQSAKHLRGRAMEDVIFNGSESRGPNGLAEVTLTFDNTNPEYAATLPIEYRDYPEIAVTRRLYRDGTSEYLLNKTQVRLRDITELFLGTGVGTKAYSIVEQGRIGQIVSARPEDRRLFLEEAAGVTKYKQRRKQAERKMDLTRQNLLRITDIVSEIDRSRASLKRQVAKAERFIEYRKELDDLVLHDASHRLLELIVTERVESDGFSATNERSQAARSSLREADVLLDAAREEALAIEIRADETSRRAFESDNEVSSLLADLERSRDRLTHLSERLDAAQTELELNEVRSKGLRDEREALAARVNELSGDERAREADALAEIEALSGLQAEEARASEEVHALRRQAGELTARSAAAEARLDGIAQRLVEARQRNDRLVIERDKLTGELSDCLARKQALERSVAELAEGKRLTQSERSELEQELQTLRGRTLESERGVDSVKNELGQKRNRLRALEDLHRRLEGVGGGARALLSKKGDPRVLGMVADRIGTPERLTLAVAGLLGDRLSCIVVADSSAQIELLAELRAGERGRADVIAARPAYVAGADRGAWHEDSAVLGRLADELSYAEADEALVRALIGDAVLVEDAASALAISRRYPGLTAVALDGTVARPDGVVSGGTGDDVASAMLDQKREMLALTSDVERLEKDYERLSTEHNALRARIADVSTSLDRARQEAHQGELAHVTAEKDLARTSAEIERAESRSDALDLELAEIERSLETATGAESGSRSELDTVRAELEHLQHALARSEATASSWREQVSAQASLVTERKVRLAQVREQAEAARIAGERIAATLTELEERALKLREETHEASVSYGETAARIMLAREARISAAERAKVAHAELEETRAGLEQVRQTLGAKEAELKGLRDELELVDEALKKHEMAVQRIAIEREHLLNTVRERFRGLDLKRVVGDYHARPAPDAEHRRRIDELAQLIDRMGPVNLDAKAEHDDAERRFVELNSQKVDIEKALEELDHAIRHMNKESRRRFKETFDEVNALFKKTFARHFRGGRAELLLTDPEDLLGSGVDIVAQPPGKKLGNIELMSGGEKALTAVSLIFAIFQHRPSPFCILDEVDAPLDEANVSRYNESIRAMTASSQFILITHIKKTMQSVDVLYGVTMGEPGVSRIVSVKVNESAVARSDMHAGLSSQARDTHAPSEPAASVEVA